MTNNVPVAFAVTYLVGVIGAAWVLALLGPKLLRVDLAKECRELEEQMREARRQSRCGANSSYGRMPSLLTPLGSGRRIAALEVAVDGQRVFVERFRSGGQVLDSDATVFCEPET